MPSHWVCLNCLAYISVTVSARPVSCPRCGSDRIEEADEKQLP